LFSITLSFSLSHTLFLSPFPPQTGKKQIEGEETERVGEKKERRSEKEREREKGRERMREGVRKRERQREEREREKVGSERG